MDPWSIELIVVRRGTYAADERRALARDVERRVLLRLRRGVHVERVGYESLDTSGRHIVRMRALAAVSDEPPVFSHWSAAVLHGLPVFDGRMDRVHVTVEDDGHRLRGQDGVAGHVLRLEDAEVLQIGPLRATRVARTVVDIAGAARFPEGVGLADAALHGGLPRELLEQAVLLAGPRRAASRIGEVVLFAHPGAESVAESESRCTQYRLGIPPLTLQHPVRDHAGIADYLDFYCEEADAGGEVDGDRKYLDAQMAPDGAAAAVIAEKRRQDRVLIGVARLARWGWREARSPARLGPVLARVGIVPDRARATLRHYAEAAAAARPRFVARRPYRAAS